MSEFDNLLRFDGLAEAEKITGKSYKDDTDTADLGFALSMMHNELKRDELSIRDDTHFSVLWVEAVRIVESLGFQLVHTEINPDTSNSDEYRLYWRDGVLLSIESYSWPGSQNPPKVNTARIWYNWKADPEIEDYLAHESSGHFHTESYDRGEKIWIGDTDVREGLRHRLADFMSRGEFLTHWVGRPFLWLKPYWDRDSDSLSVSEKEKNKSYRLGRIDLLPAHVRSAVSPEN